MYFGNELCLTIVNETCGETTHCQELDPILIADGPDRPGRLGGRGGKLGDKPGGKSLVDDNGSNAFPNPFTNHLTVVPTAEVTELELLNATGQRVRQVNAKGTRVELLTGDLPAGLYFLRGSDASGLVVMTRKLVHR